MTRDLRYARSAYAMRNLSTLKAERIAERLKSAPLEVRRLGLPLAVAGWDRENKPELVTLVAGWLYGEWGMLPQRAVPQSAVALLRALEEDDMTLSAVRSAAEIEAEEMLQAAKVLAGAAAGGGGGPHGS